MGECVIADGFKSVKPQKRIANRRNCAGSRLSGGWKVGMVGRWICNINTRINAARFFCQGGWVTNQVASEWLGVMGCDMVNGCECVIADCFKSIKPQKRFANRMNCAGSRLSGGWKVGMVGRWICNIKTRVNAARFFCQGGWVTNQAASERLGVMGCDMVNGWMCYCWLF